MEFYKKFIGNRLKFLRYKYSLNLESVKSYLRICGENLSISTLYKWEEGKVFPSLEILFLLSEFYDYPISSILDDNLLNIFSMTNAEIYILTKYKYNINIKIIIDQMYELYLEELRYKNKKLK